MIGKRFDAYHAALIEHNSQRLSAFAASAGLSSSAWPVFPEHTVNRVLEKVCTQGWCTSPEGTYIFLWMHIHQLTLANQSLCSCVHWRWYAVITEYRYLRLLSQALC